MYSCVRCAFIANQVRKSIGVASPPSVDQIAIATKCRDVGGRAFLHRDRDFGLIAGVEPKLMHVDVKQ
jgi:hypothetical protein